MFHFLHFVLLKSLDNTLFAILKNFWNFENHFQSNFSKSILEKLNIQKCLHILWFCLGCLKCFERQKNHSQKIAVRDLLSFYCYCKSSFLYGFQIPKGFHIYICIIFFFPYPVFLFWSSFPNHLSFLFLVYFYQFTLFFLIFC